MERREKSIEDLESRKNNQQQELIVMREQWTEKKNQLNQIEATADTDLAKSKQADKEVERFERNVHEKKSKVKQVDREISRLRKDRAKLDDKITELSSQGDSDSSAENDRLKASRAAQAQCVLT